MIPSLMGNLTRYMVECLFRSMLFVTSVLVNAFSEGGWWYTNICITRKSSLNVSVVRRWREAGERSLTLQCTLKNGQTYFKNLAEWIKQDFLRMFDHFS